MSGIEVEVRREVSWIRLNCPEQMNAYDAQMAQALIEAIEITVPRLADALRSSRQAYLEE